MFEKIAYAEGVQQSAQTANPILSFLPLILMIGVFYFLLIRPQQKRQKDLQKLVDGLKKGDRVITAGGMIGTITGVQSDYVVLKTGESDTVKMEVLKSAITGIRENQQS